MKLNFKDKKNILKIQRISLTKYDFIIIGSGPAAVALCNKLISNKNNNFKILMIEKGDYFQKAYKKILQKNLPIKSNSRVFSVGGSSNDWSNISSYFEKFEIESLKNKNIWPLSHNELIYYYKNLNKEYGFGYEKLNKKNLESPFTIREFIIKNDPINFKNLINLKKIDLLYNCEIKSIDDFKSFSYVFTKKKTISFVAKKLILCCGGIETVHLILKSLKKRKLKKMINKKLVGSYFMNHPKLNLGYILYPKIKLIKPLLLSKGKIFSSYYGVSLNQKTQKKLNMLNSYIRFEKSYGIIAKLLTTFRYPIINNLLKKKEKLFYKIRLFCEMIPKKKNKIQLINNNLRIDYSFSRTDYKTIELLIKKIIKYFSYKPENESKIEFSPKYLNKNSQDASHHLGGLIYSHNKKKKNVDKDLKIYGLYNTYACSSAIFPTAGSANPTMTIVALANRLGVHLLQKIQTDKNFIN
jgi:hypothetical protein